MLVLDFVMAGLFGLCLYLFIKNPLSKKYDTPPWTDPLLGFVLTMVVVGYFYIFHYAIKIVPENEFSPCGKRSVQIECYAVSEETCMIAWNSSRGSCDERIEEIIKERPAALVGAFLNTCISRNFDKVMHYNRRNETQSNCMSYFSKVDKK